MLDVELIKSPLRFFSYLTKCENQHMLTKQEGRGKEKYIRKIFVLLNMHVRVLSKDQVDNLFISLKWTKQYKSLIKGQHVEKVGATPRRGIARELRVQDTLGHKLVWNEHKGVSLMKNYICRHVSQCMQGCACGCAHALHASCWMRMCVLSEAAPGRGSDIEDGLNPVLHSSGRP